MFSRESERKSYRKYSWIAPKNEQISKQTEKGEEVGKLENVKEKSESKRNRSGGGMSERKEGGE